MPIRAHQGAHLGGTRLGTEERGTRTEERTSHRGARISQTSASYAQERSSPARAHLPDARNLEVQIGARARSTCLDTMERSLRNARLPGEHIPYSGARTSPASTCLQGASNQGMHLGACILRARSARRIWIHFNKIPK